MPIAAVAPSTMMPTLHVVPRKDRSGITAITTVSTRKEEMVRRRQPWQDDDWQEVNLVEESLKLLGQSNEKKELSCCFAFFQGAQDYLEGMAAAEGVGEGRGRVGSKGERACK